MEMYTGWVTTRDQQTPWWGMGEPMRGIGDWRQTSEDECLAR